MNSLSPFRLNTALLALLTVTLLCAAPAAADDAQDDEQARTLERLQQQFGSLHNTLRERGGIREKDLNAITRLRDRFATFNEQYDDPREGLAGELQLSSWLEEHDRVDSLFEQMMLQDPTDQSVGFAWAGYFMRLERQDRVDEIYSRLLELNPDSRELRLALARRVKIQNNYPRALEILQPLELDPEQDAEILLLKSECLFAENRFEEALDAVRAIPEQVREDDPRIGQQVESALPDREAYVTFWTEELEQRDADASADNLPRVQIVTPRGDIIVELFEDDAPNTVANFVSLAEDGYYDGTLFHRVVPNFMAQGGDPNSKPGNSGRPGTGGPGYVIADEINEDSRKHFAGTLSMANSGPNTNGSQFFLTHRPTPRLNGDHTVFGRVLEGLDVVRSLQANDAIESMQVLRKRDHDYDIEHYAGDDEEVTDGEQMQIPDQVPPAIQEQLEQKQDDAGQ